MDGFGLRLYAGAGLPGAAPGKPSPGPAAKFVTGTMLAVDGGVSIGF